MDDELFKQKARCNNSKEHNNRQSLAAIQSGNMYGMTCTCHKYLSCTEEVRGPTRRSDGVFAWLYFLSFSKYWERKQVHCNRSVAFVSAST